MDSSTKLSTFYRAYDKARMQSVIRALEDDGAHLFSVEPDDGKARLGFMCHRADWERLKKKAGQLQ